MEKKKFPVKVVFIFCQSANKCYDVGCFGILIWSVLMALQAQLLCQL